MPLANLPAGTVIEVISVVSVPLSKTTVLPFNICHSAAVCALPIALSEKALAVNFGVTLTPVAFLAGELLVGVVATTLSGRVM